MFPDAFHPSDAGSEIRAEEAGAANRKLIVEAA
jgi:hypothetical protein